MNSVFALCLVAVTLTPTMSLEVAANPGANKPVTKVINLLKDMLAQLEKDHANDQSSYDTHACWCQTNEKIKTKAIADAEARIADLTTQVEELAALVVQLAKEIESLEKETAENQAALEKATAIRQKQLAGFNGEEKELLDSISALKAAITVLSKHHGDSLLQMPRSRMLSVAATLQHAMQNHAELLQGVLTHTERRTAASFIQAPEDYFDAAPTFKQSYAPGSGEIFGILRQMKDTFEKGLSDSQKEEMANQKAYDELKAAKEAEIAAGREQIETKTQTRATKVQELAQAKQDIEDTEASLATDQEFLEMLQQKCAVHDKDWDSRQATRQSEVEAISKAIAILSHDEAHDLYHDTFNFLQKRAGSHSERRTRAAQLLSSAAHRLHSPRLATLATNVRLDAFTRVKKAIDDMMAALAQEKADEIKQKDFCNKELNANEKHIQKKERERDDLQSKIDNLNTRIKQLTDELDVLKAEIADLRVQLKRAGENREIENRDYTLILADQRATQAILKQAYASLESFYGQRSHAGGLIAPAHGSALMQQAPPPGFDDYEHNSNHPGVMQMITQIINDAHGMEDETIRAEEDSQKAYETFVKESNRSINDKTKEIIDKTDDKAKAEEDLVNKKAAHEAAVSELEKLANYKAQLHGSCDFVLKNFDLRQTARDQEVEALRQAKQILSGSDFTAFLQGA